jgi:hypothetical protein
MARRRLLGHEHTVYHDVKELGEILKTGCDQNHSSSEAAIILDWETVTIDGLQGLK